MLNADTPPTLSKPSGFAPTALFYITIGAIMTIWSGVWFSYLRNHSTGETGANYVALGFLGTGITLLVLGIIVGPIARWSRQAELPPSEVEPTQTSPQNVTIRQT